MQFKNFSTITLAAVVFSLCGCEFLRQHSARDIFSGNWNIKELGFNQSPTYQGYETNVPLLKKPSSVVVCRSRQCAPAKLSMSKEYIYNSLLQLFDNNNYQNMLVCQGDAQTRTCIENYVTLPVKVGIVPTNAYIDHIKITDVINGKQANALNLILNYNVTYGGQTAECTPSRSLLFARSVDHVLLEDTGYNCKMTTIGNTNVKTVFAIDYVDLDYGYIGGYYSIGFSGPAYGGGNGYMILRMPKNAYPLSPALTAPKQNIKPLSNSPIGTAGMESLSLNSNRAENSPYANGVQIFPIEKKSDDKASN